MKNVKVLLALSLFTYLRTALDSAVISQPASTSDMVLRQTYDVFKEFLVCDFTCMSGEVNWSDTNSRAVTDQANYRLGLLQMVCTRMGCVGVPDEFDHNPSIPIHPQSLPAIFKKDTHRFEAPGILAGLIIES